MRKRNWKKSVLSLFMVVCMLFSMTNPVMAENTKAVETTESTESQKETEGAEHVNTIDAVEITESTEKPERTEETKSIEETEITKDTESIKEPERTEETEETETKEEVSGKNTKLVLEEVDEEEIEDAELPVSAEEVKEQEPEYEDDEMVRVFIVFESDAVLDAGFDTMDLASNEDAMKMAEDIKEEQEEAAEEISEDALEGETLDVRYNFTILSNALSANVEYGDIERIREVEGVEEVYITPRYEIQDKDTAEPQMATAGPMVGSTATWANGYTGAGQRIAVIDTGIDADHPSFDGAAFDYSLGLTAAKAGKTADSYHLLDKGEIAAVLPNLNAASRKSGVTAEDLFLSDKIAFAFNYVDRNLDVTHDNDTEGDHGTHVSGISCSNLYVPSADGSYTKQSAGVVGIAPDAQLIAMKVFGSNGGAYTDDYMAAIEDALLLKCDAINLSLGSSSAGDSADSEAYINEIFAKLQGCSTVVSISAGNAGAWSDDSIYGGNMPGDVNMDTVGSPGSYTNALTVASAVNSGYTGYGAAFDGVHDAVYTDAEGAPSIAALDTAGSGTEYEYILLDAYGKAEDLEGMNLEGKILLVSRGEISFAEKHTNASEAKAAGIMIYNNTAGTISMSLSGTTGNIPCASLTKADAEIIKNNAVNNHGVYTGKVKIFNQVKTYTDLPDGYTMSDFSSWGVPGSLELKPEITAPGGNIYSTLDGGEYGQMSGTSMAAPSVAGMSALVAQYIKEKGLSEKTGLSIRTLSQSLLMSTATPLTEPDKEEYSVRNQGAGLANVGKATTSPAYILVGEKEGNDGKVKIELGDDPQKNGVYSFSFHVYNMDDKPHVYTTDSAFLTEDISAGLITGTSYKLNPTVSITSSETYNFYDLNFDGAVDTKDAAVLLSHVNGTSLTAAVEEYWDKFDFNKDEKVDTADVHGFLSAIKSGSSIVTGAEQVIAVKDCTKVEVTVTLSEADRNYLAQFENGMYVDGFIYLRGGVDLSVPMLAFYGNWADSSMFEPFDFLEYANNGDNWEYPYTTISVDDFDYTNYLTYQYAGSNKKLYYFSNMYSENGDAAYLPERNAISSESGDMISAVSYSLIRNAARVNVAVTNAQNGEVYFETKLGNRQAEYYSASAAAWQSTLYTTALNWKGTDAAGKALSDGTKVNISVTAIPAYYDGVDAAAIPGKGLTFSVPMTIDNERPTAVAEPKDAAVSDGKLNITVKDNRYVAAVCVYGNDKKTLLKTYDVNQTVAGAESTIEMEDVADVFYIRVLDYAGNYTTYRVNHSGEADTEVVSELTLDKSELTLIKGSQGQLTAACKPVTLLDDSVTWTSSNTDVVTVNENGVLTAVAVGTATVTAVTTAKDSSGNPLTASCTVTVESLEADINGVVWDEDGSVFWSKFNSSTLPDYTKLSEKQSNRYMSAAYVGGGKVLAATDNGSSSQTSDLYLVDTANGYSSTLLAGGAPWCTDMTYSAGNDVVYSIYGPYLEIINPATGELKGPYNIGMSDYMSGIAYAATSEGDDYLYAITEKGGLWQIAINPNEMSVGKARIAETGVETGWYYNSLCYDASKDYLFWTRFNFGNNVTLYALKDTSTESEPSADIFELGDFADDVWPIAGLYRKDAGTSSAAASRMEGLLQGAAMEQVEKATDTGSIRNTVETGK